MAQHPNRILNALPQNIFAAVQPHLKPVELTFGDIVAETGEPIERVIQFQRMIALALRDREKTCFCAGARMDIDRAPIGDDKTLGAERFQPDIIGAGRDGALDASGQ